MITAASPAIIRAVRNTCRLSYGSHQQWLNILVPRIEASKIIESPEDYPDSVHYIGCSGFGTHQRDASCEGE